MSVELKRAVKDILIGLPSGHPDRKFVRRVLGVIEEYNTKKEIPVAPRRFSSEAREALKNAGFVIYELNGHSIIDLRNAGRQFFVNWHIDNEIFETLNSMVSEVAINPSQFFLPESNWCGFPQREQMVAQFSENLARTVPGVKAVIGTVPDYLELYFSHRDLSGEKLFGERLSDVHTRIQTCAVGESAYISSFYPDHEVGVTQFFIGIYPEDVFAAPLVVPD